MQGRRKELQNYWDAKASNERNREVMYPAKQVHTDLIWREIHRQIDFLLDSATSSNGSNKRETKKCTCLKILDAGAGPGRFSIPLAAMGHEVIHTDISSEMLKIAKETAEQKKKKEMRGTIRFIQHDIADPLSFPDNCFDLVISIDSPLSYCVDNYASVLSELVRVAKSCIILCVQNKLGIITEDAGSFDFTHFGKLKTLWDVFKTGTLDVTSEIRSLEPSLMPSWHCFTPEEIRELLESNNCHITHISSPGSFSRFMNSEHITKALENKGVYEDLLDFAETFDSQPDILGLGAIGAGGLLITGIKKQ